ncbi:MAG: hypothetical protein CL840_07265 [Crocinitomicaceae bacterium]|nr:hypothetical protein [Crocinitomicaceae bacterium]|tara:strand:+ start:21530 stop:21967 length:438 start_codon:yes stop_codon:yes gene_type:complete
MKDKPKLNRGFFISWIITFVFLYGVSYLWHGVLLNDLSRVNYSINLFLVFVAVIYFVIAFVLTFLTHFLIQFNKNKIKRGLFIGIPIGVFIYLVAFVFGISFYSDPTIDHIILDLTWQVVEQALGGIVAGVLLTISDMSASRQSI